jgi:fluoride ion exporter CrcB/FEX
MQGPIWGYLLVSGLAGFLIGCVVMWVARGSWVGRVIIGLLGLTCFIATAVEVEMAFQASHSESLASIFFLAVSFCIAAAGLGLLLAIFVPRPKSP